MKKKTGFTREELKSIAGLASVIGLRMLGLSTIIPVFAVYAVNMPEATPFLAGLAFGVYGLTQAILQIPFGYLSDRLGRKPVVITGLLIFGIGSVIAAVTTNIYVLIAARFLQGAGAIASACFAWIADLTHESRRNMAMAFMGIAIGGGIVTGMIFGPVLGAAFGVPFLFWLAAFFSGVAIVITLNQNEPTTAEQRKKLDFSINPKKAFSFVSTPDLLKLDVAGFMTNMTMIAIFFAVPLKLAEKFEMAELWKIYLPLGVMGGLAMMLSSKSADKGSQKKVLAFAILAVVASLVIFSLSSDVKVTLAGFSLFFAAFSVLEATLPAAVSKLADPTHKGSIIGAYNFSQFMGTFAGGILAGLMASTNSGPMFWFLAGGNMVAAILVFSAKGLDRSEP